LSTVIRKYVVWYTGTGVMNCFVLIGMHQCKCMF